MSIRLIEVPKEPLITIDDFFNHFENIANLTNEEILNLDFKLSKERQDDKTKAYIKIALPENAKEITEIFKDAYKGTYPYKIVEDAQEIVNMINSSDNLWLIFKTIENESIGCFSAELDFDSRKGRLYGFAIKNSYQKKVDSLKIFIGCTLYIWKQFKEQIDIWFAEIRTNETSAQYATSMCGLKPIAFFPNKDIFLNQIESDFLSITYNKAVLDKYRCKKTPRIIRQVLDSYAYCNKLYHIGLPIIENPINKVDTAHVNHLKNKLLKKVENGSYYNQIITLYFENSKSFIKFTFNPLIHTIEHTKYDVNNLDELLVLLEETKELIKYLKVRYFQCFVSSYQPDHQMMFLEEGFIPSGYVPCWNYNASDHLFEDSIIFFFQEGDIISNIKLTKETEFLLKELKFYELIEKKVERKISYQLLTKVDEIVDYLQLGISIPIIQQLRKYVILDLNYFKARSILLLEDGNPIGHVLVYDDNSGALFFGYFNTLSHQKDHIKKLINILKEYANENNYKVIRGPINIPAIIFGWGFLKEGGLSNLFIGKPVNPSIYIKCFYEMGFNLSHEINTWEGTMPRINPWKLKKYNFEDFEYFYPNDIEDFQKYKKDFLKLHAKNLPGSARLTPNVDGVLDHYLEFTFEFGRPFYIFFVKFKPSNKIVACGACLPNPFRKNKDGNYDSVVFYTWAVDPKFRRKGLTQLMYGATSMLLWKKGVRYSSGPVSNDNKANSEVAKKLTAKNCRTHVIFELQL